jgi:peptide/nickel transport system permease protein
MAATLDRPSEPTTRSGRSLGADAVRRLRRDRSAVACFLVICVYAAVAVVAPLRWSDWEKRYDYDNIQAAPSLKYLTSPATWTHVLGTDEFGRSVLVKTFLGAHVSMMVGLMSNIIAVPLGILLGAIAGYFGRWIDDAVVWLYTTLASIPGIISLIALKFAFQGRVLFEGRWYALDLGGLAGIYVALGLLSWIGTCRLVRAEVLKLRELDYVVAARAVGGGHLAILRRHILPNILHLGIINFSLGFVGAVTSEVILSYLGLGVGGNTPSWGKMIDASRMDLVVGRWWELGSAVVAIFVLMLALNIFGDRLRDALDPRLRTS